MEFHRTEVIESPTGRSVRVDVVAASPHSGDHRAAIHALKYRGRTGVALTVAESLVPLVGVFDDAHWCLVTWTPTSDRRRRARGYDQAELVARHLAALVGIRHRRLLRRTSASHQTGAPRSVRLVGPTFVARPGLAGDIVVVDDVTTTGATFIAAARTLAAAGATRVLCVAATHTPERSGRFFERDAAGFGNRFG